MGGTITTLNLENADPKVKSEVENSFTPPVDYEGCYYDPKHPPQITFTSDGKLRYIGGEPISKDRAYSEAYWNHLTEVQELSLKEIADMRSGMEKAIRDGVVSFAVKELDEHGEFYPKDMAKIAAYKITANDIGYGFESYDYDVETSEVKIITKSNSEISSLV